MQNVGEILSNLGVPNPSYDEAPVLPRVRRGVKTVQDALDGEDNTVPASQNFRIHTNNPRMEMVANLLAMGRSRKAIADIIGISYSTVITLSSQPYVRERVRALLRENGGNEVQAFLRTQVMSNLETYVEIRDNPGNRPADRKAAADALLDRALGKPVQHIETNGGDDVKEATLELASLQSTLQEKTAQLRALGVSVS